MRAKIILCEELPLPQNEETSPPHFVPFARQRLRRRPSAYFAAAIAVLPIGRASSSD
jgi:hypothetical protein